MARKGARLRGVVDNGWLRLQGASARALGVDQLCYLPMEGLEACGGCEPQQVGHAGRFKVCGQQVAVRAQPELRGKARDARLCMALLSYGCESRWDFFKIFIDFSSTFHDYLAFAGIDAFYLEEARCHRNLIQIECFAGGWRGGLWPDADGYTAQSGWIPVAPLRRELEEEGPPSGRFELKSGAKMMKDRCFTVFFCVFS